MRTKAKRNYALLAAAAAVIVWAVATHHRAGVPASVTVAPAATVTAWQRPRSDAMSSAAPAPAAQSSAPSGTAEAEPAEAASGPRAEAPDTATQDLHQAGKIARGMSANPGGGILVNGTPPGSVTGQLRLRAGDIIVSVNGDPISSPEEFVRLYREQGLPSQLTILRDGREIHRH